MRVEVAETGRDIRDEFWLLETETGAWGLLADMAKAAVVVGRACCRGAN